MLKLEEKQTDKEIDFEDVPVGSVFKFDYSYFMRISSGKFNAVKLSNGAGALVSFIHFDKCLMVDATLVIGGN